MASNKTPTTLGSLEFSEIKNNLTTFLQNQDIFKGYNFQGSAIQTIIDLLAYNTFYYAYYANMINSEAFLDSAQREESLISLCKPLGYLVPDATAARAKIQVSGITNLIELQNQISETTRFFAVDGAGTEYTFYPLKNIPIDEDGNTDIFDVYEASLYSELDYLPTFDFQSQKISIAGADVDFSKIRVQTVEEGITYTWTLVNNLGYVAQTNERIFFVERTSAGFVVQFGSQYSLGKSIDEQTTDNLFVRYITTNGSVANNLQTFSVGRDSEGVVVEGVVVVTTRSLSMGGKNTPSPEEIRFLAPKWFASQERAVTVNDYKALLIESGYFQNETQFNVFGGQDTSPPRYGRVFVSSNLDFDENKITEMINFLKERSVITVLPEYVISNALNVNVDFNFGISDLSLSRSATLSRVRSSFNQNFAKDRQYNVSFSAADCIDLLQKQESNKLIISPDNFKLYVQEELSGGVEYTFNLENELKIPLLTEIDLTEPFECAISDFPQNAQAVIRMFLSSNSARNVKVDLRLYAVNIQEGFAFRWDADVGYFIANRGVINIKEGIIANSARMRVDFQKSSILFGLNNLVSLAANNISVQ